MSNPEKMKVDDDTEKEKEDSSDEQWSGDEESAMRQIVLGLPALAISTGGGSSAVAEEEQARLNEQAVVAAELVIAAAEEAVMKEKSDGKKKKVSRRQRKMMKLNDDEAGGSSKGEVKKPRKKSSEFTNLPRGPPVCNVCGRGFGSWKAVFGHLRSHKDRNYRGFLPPPRFTAPARGVVIPGPNSAFVRVVPRGGSSGGVVASGGGGGGTGGEGGGGSGIDMNVDVVEEGNQEVTESGTVAKFDLNKSPPKDEEEEDKTK